MGAGWRKRLATNLERFSWSCAVINDKISGSRALHKVVGLLSAKNEENIQGTANILKRIKFLDELFCGDMQCKKRLKIGRVQLKYWETYTPAYGIWTIGNGELSATGWRR